MKENNRHSQEFFESDPQAKQIRNVCLAALEMLSEILWTHPIGRPRYYAVLEMLDGALIDLGVSSGHRQKMVLDQSLIDFASKVAAGLGKNAPTICQFKPGRSIARDAEAVEVATRIAGELSSWLGRFCEMASDDELTETINLFYQLFDAPSPENG